MVADGRYGRGNGDKKGGDGNKEKYLDVGYVLDMELKELAD